METVKHNVLNTPLDIQQKLTFTAGDIVRLCGTIYTARDAAHLIMCESLERMEPLPFALEGAIIFYAGPTPKPPLKPCGAIGPTTSARMAKYAEPIFSQKIGAILGKGLLPKKMKASLQANNVLYLIAIGGSAALLSKHVIDCNTIDYDNLGAEAVHCLTVKDFPCIVAIDLHGGDIFVS